MPLGISEHLYPWPVWVRCVDLQHDGHLVGIQSHECAGGG